MSRDRGTANNEPKRRTLHNTLRRKQRSDAPPATPGSAQPSPAQQPDKPVRRGNTLIRKRRSNSASNTHKAEVPQETCEPAVKHEPPPVETRRHSHNERAPIDARDTSDVWLRRTIKDRLSLSSVNPRLLFSGIKPPHLLQVLVGNAKPKEPKEEPRPPPSETARSKRSHRHRHRHHPHGEHRHRHRSNTDLRRRPVPPIPTTAPAGDDTGSGSGVREHRHRHRRPVPPIPAPIITNANDTGTETREHRHRHRHRNAESSHRRPVPPIPMPTPVVTVVDSDAGKHEEHEPRLSETPLLESMAYNMPIPEHFDISGEAMEQTSQDADRKHRLSTASGDDDSHPVHVYKVLGRVTSSLESGSNMAQSPVLVTVSRNGSVTSEVSLAHRRSEENNSSIFQSISTSVLPSLRSPPISSLISKQRADYSSKALSPSQQTISTGGFTSLGGDSFTTARLYTGAASPKGLVSNMSVSAVTSRKRRDSDVSDIAMRKHLVITDDRAGLERSRSGSIYSGYEIPASANRTFSEWLRTQMTGEEITPENQVADTSATIAQAVARSPSAGPDAHSSGTSDGAPQVPDQLPQSHQRHFNPPSTHAPSEDPQAFGMLVARVSDLETRFTCMEALLTSLEDELSELAVTPRTLSRLRHAISATRLTAGMRPVVGAVTFAPSVAGLQSQTDLASNSLVNSASGRGDDTNSELDREETAVAVQTTAVALAELVGKSRKEFDQATTSALSSISALVSGMQTMRRLDKNLADNELPDPKAVD